MSTSRAKTEVRVLSKSRLIPRKHSTLIWKMSSTKRSKEIMIFIKESFTVDSWVRLCHLANMKWSLESNGLERIRLLKELRNIREINSYRTETGFVLMMKKLSNIVDNRFLMEHGQRKKVMFRLDKKYRNTMQRLQAQSKSKFLEIIISKVWRSKQNLIIQVVWWNVSIISMKLWDRACKHM